MRWENTFQPGCTVEKLEFLAEKWWWYVRHTLFFDYKINVLINFWYDASIGLAKSFYGCWMRSIMRSILS